MKNIAIIPARSGSKGFKNKNIRLLNGKPLIFYSIDAAIKSKCFDEIMLSTDSEEYAELGISLGASVPFLRSEINSSDKASSWDVVKEVLSNYENKGMKFDTICLLQPTSPLRKPMDIVNAYGLFLDKNADAITSVCEAEHSPLWSNMLPKDLSLNNFYPSSSKARRQDLPTYYRLNGAIYIRKIDYDNEIIINNKNEFAYIMSNENSIDIDTELDFKIAEILMKEYNK